MQKHCCEHVENDSAADGGEGRLQTVVAAASVMALTLHLSLKYYSDNRYIYDYTQLPSPIPVVTCAVWDFAEVWRY